MSAFKIKDLNFNVTKAIFKGHIGETLYWSISINGRYPEGRFRGEQWKPRAYSDDLLPIAGRALNRWSDILGQSIRWTNNYLDKTGEYIASLHVFEHMDIYRSELILGELSGKDSFNIDWNALCDLSFDEDYGNSLELFIQTEVKLEGIEVPFQFQDEKESLALLRKHIREGEFTFEPGDGKHYKPIFRPK